METPRKNTIGKARPILIELAIIVALSNTPPAQFFLLEQYSYQNRDGSFAYSEEPGKGMDLQAGLIQFQGWKKENPTDGNTVLYRTFRIRPWRFWEWWQYIAHPKRFALPHIGEANKK